jgi:uncharacterized protein YkwD
MCNTIGKLAHGNVKASALLEWRYMTSWKTCAEIVSYNDSSDTGIVTAVRQWNQSSNHAATMKDTKFKYAGYNNFACPDGRFYSTTIFIEA